LHARASRRQGGRASFRLLRLPGYNGVWNFPTVST
jgi:hypothetical protein